MPNVEYFKQINDKIIYLYFHIPHSRSFLSSLKSTYSYNSNVAVIPQDKFEDLVNNGAILNSKDAPSSLNSAGPYPIAVRYLTPNYAVIERPPFQIKVDYSPSKSGLKRRSIKPVTIWIPWTVLIADLTPGNFFAGSRLYFNDKPLETLDDVIAFPYTSNIFGDGRICMGRSSYALNEVDQNNYTALYHAFINEYFSGGWNSDTDSGTYHRMLNASPDKIPNLSYVTEEFLSKMKSNKISFYKSSSYAFSTANLYYSFSLLNLEETLAVVTDYKNKYFDPNHSYGYGYANTLRGYLNKNKNDSNKDFNRNIPAEYYSHSYCNVSLTIHNETYEQMRDEFAMMEFNERMQFIDKSSALLTDFIASTLDYIIDKVYENIQNDLYNLSLEFTSTFYEPSKNISINKENIDV
jgi:hypothetical protein